MMKKEEKQNSRRLKLGWWLLKLWFGMLCASLLCNCCIVGVMSLIIKKAPVHNAEYTYLLLIFYGFMIIALTIGATTLFLNCLKRIRENKVYRFLSFFLLPLLIAVADIGSRVSHNQHWSDWSDWSDWKEIIVLCPVYFVFFLCLTSAYIFFLRKQP